VKVGGEDLRKDEANPSGVTKRNKMLGMTTPEELGKMEEKLDGRMEKKMWTSGKEINPEKKGKTQGTKIESGYGRKKKTEDRVEWQ